MIRRSHKFIAYILSLSLLIGTCSVPALAANNEGEQNTPVETVTEEDTSSSGDDSSSGSGDQSSQEGNGSSDSGNEEQGSGGQGDDQTGNGQDANDGNGEGQNDGFNPDEEGANGEFNPDDPNGEGNLEGGDELNQDGENPDGENPDGENPDGENLENGGLGEGQETDESSGEGQTQNGDENPNGGQDQNEGQGQGAGDGQSGSGDGQNQDPDAPRTDLSAAELSLETTSYSYDGTAPHPGVTVTIDGTTLERGLDYDVIYDESAELGTHIVTVIGTGNYTGTLQAEYTIAKRKQTVSGKQSYTKRLGYDPFKIQAKTNGDGKLVYRSSNPKVVTVSKSGKVTIKGTGTATISVFADETEYCRKSNVLRVTVKVLKKQQKVTGASSYTKSLGTDDFKIDLAKEGNGKLIYESSNNNVATVSASGKVTVKAVGSAKITVYAAETATCLQSMAKVITIKVGPNITALSGVTNTANNKATVEWEMQDGISGYQIQYSAKEDFSKSKVVTASASDTSKVLSGLTSNANYYVRIRAYKEESDRKLYAEWSEPKAVSVKIGAPMTYDSTPEIKVATDNGTYENTVFWEKIPGATGYQVSCKVGEDGIWTIIKTTSDTFFTQKVEQGVKYYYQVRAFTDKEDGSREYGEYSKGERLSGAAAETLSRDISKTVADFHRILLHRFEEKSGLSAHQAIDEMK